MAGIVKRLADSAIDTFLNLLWLLIAYAVWGAWGAAVIAATLGAWGHFKGFDPKWVDRALTVAVTLGFFAILAALQALARRRKPRPIQLRETEFIKFPASSSLGNISEHWADLEHNWERCEAAYRDLVRIWGVSLKKLAKVTLDARKQYELRPLVDRTKTDLTEHVERGLATLNTRARDLADLVQKLSSEW
jgi:hypothetical protein